MKYILGAYHLFKAKALRFGSYEGKKVLTASSCLNPPYLDAWSFSWAEDGKHNLDIPGTEFSIPEEAIRKLQGWADKKLDQKQLGWPNIFTSLESLLEYKRSFFPNETTAVATAIYFDEADTSGLIQEFEPKTDRMGEIGILQLLKSNIEEREEIGECIGYDLIGIEFSGDYHSFHCYDTTAALSKKFGIEFNEFGLIKGVDQKEALKEYANNPDNGLPFIPWFLVKVRKIKISNDITPKTL